MPGTGIILSFYYQYINIPGPISRFNTHVNILYVLKYWQPRKSGVTSGECSGPGILIKSQVLCF